MPPCDNTAYHRSACAKFDGDRFCNFWLEHYRRAGFSYCTDCGQFWNVKLEISSYSSSAFHVYAVCSMVHDSNMNYISDDCTVLENT